MADPTWATVTVSGRVLGADKRPVKGHVAFRPRVPRLVDLEHVISIVGNEVIGYVNPGTGLMSVQLFPTDDPRLSQTGFTWEVTEVFEGGVVFDIEVPLAAVGTGLAYATQLPPVDPETGLPTLPKDATTALKGVVELATSAETTAGTDTMRAVTPAGVKAATDAVKADVSTIATARAVALSVALGG